MPNFKTTTRGMNKQHFIPNKEALTKMLDTISNPDAADYAAVQIAKRLGKNETTGPVIKKIEDYARSMHGINGKQTSTSIWTGRREPLTDFVSLQQFLADQSIDNVKELMQEAGLMKENGEFDADIQLDFAVNDKAQFVRGYKLNGQTLNSKAMTELMDDVFKAWLAEKGMFYKNGQLYQVDEMGKIMKNNQGKDMLMAKEEIFQRLQDDNNGFSSYLKKQGIQAQVIRRAFPESESEADRQQDVQEALKHGQHGGVENATGAEVEPEKPGQSTPSSR